MRLIRNNDLVRIAEWPASMRLPVLCNNTPCCLSAILNPGVFDSEGDPGSHQQQENHPEDIFDMFGTCAQLQYPDFRSQRMSLPAALERQRNSGQEKRLSYSQFWCIRNG